MLYTYQDYLEVLETGSDTQLIQFVYNAIQNHKNSDKREIAVVADEYFRHLDRTIIDYQKLLYTVEGKAVPDNYSANYKLSSNFFFIFVTQLVQYLFSNGVSWQNSKTAEILGDKFDENLQDAGEKALIGSASFSYVTEKKIEVFSYDEFVPFYDEENNALCAGIHFWQIAKNKPLIAVLYDIDGFMQFVWKNGEGSIKVPKTPHRITVSYTDIGGVENYKENNYPTFPVVPFFGINKQSELVGRREQIDCFDLIKSNFANTVDEASLIYWTISGAGGMRDMDLAKFVERIKTLHAATVGDGQQITSHAVEAPHSSREALLERLRNDLYDDFMAFDVKSIASGSVVNAQIESAYQPLDIKTNKFEYNALAYIRGVLNVLGIEDSPTFTRSKIVNVSELVSVILQSGEHLDDEYTTRKILELFGDGDKAEEVLKRKDAEDMMRISISDNENQQQEAEQG